MVDLRSGPYNIYLDEQQCLGMDLTMGDSVVILLRSVAPGKILWHVHRKGRGSITLMNLESGKFAGIRDAPEANEPVVGVDTPIEFMPEPGREPGTFKLLAAGTENLALGLSLKRPDPPRTALRPSDEAPVWRFQFLE
ncbi:hypothetical protein FRC06_009913 [Ceratobasidium sp. 370]|nr:hypothetical protein FRC06_009913 [Ceratobasidium sp. 370]